MTDTEPTSERPDLTRERVVFAESEAQVYVYDHVNNWWEAWARVDDDRDGVGYDTEELPDDAGPLYSPELWPHPEKVRADAAEAKLAEVTSRAVSSPEGGEPPTPTVDFAVLYEYERQRAVAWAEKAQSLADGHRMVVESMAAQLDDRIALLRRAAEGRREYSAALREDEPNSALSGQRDALLAQAAALESAAKIMEGDNNPLYGLVPSWRWTDEEVRALETPDPAPSPNLGAGDSEELARRNRSLEDMSDAARKDNLRIIRALGLAEDDAIDDVVARAEELFGLTLRQEEEETPAPEVPELVDLPPEVRRLVHAVDRMLHNWNDPDGKWTNDELWRHLHACNAAIWSRLDLAPSVGGDSTPSVPRELLGRWVRQTWVAWASEQDSPKPSWLLPWEGLDAGQQEVDMRIGEALYGAGRAAENPALIFGGDSTDTAPSQYQPKPLDLPPIDPDTAWVHGGLGEDTVYRAPAGSAVPNDGEFMAHRIALGSDGNWDFHTCGRCGQALPGVGLGPCSASPPSGVGEVATP